MNIEQAAKKLINQEIPYLDKKIANKLQIKY